jgi:Fe-S cluster biosynthesis and repair protein YggX
MPKPTEASSNTLRQATPELEIHGPTANELPATWLTGETITLTATGGDGWYQWLTTAPEAVSIQHRQDNRCEVAIEGTAAAQILAFSAGEAAIYKGLTGNRPLLKAVDNRPRHYLEAEQYCQKIGGSLPSKQTIEAILKARKTEVVAWAKKSFPVTLGTSPRIWLKDEAYSDHTQAIETKKNEIEAQQNSLQELKDKEQDLLGKGANLPEDAIKRNAELAGFDEVVKQNELAYHTEGNTFKDPIPSTMGDKIIEKFVNEALTEHRENQTALSGIREKLHTAQGTIKRQWQELVELKIQQEKFEAHSSHPSINLETAAYFDQTEAIETKKNAIEAKQNSLQALTDKEQALLEKGANLPEATIKRNAELAGFEEVIKQNEFTYRYDVNTIKDPTPNSKGEKIIEKFVNEAVAAHRENQTALGDIREKLHTAQGTIKRQWEELTELKIQQAKVEAHSGQPSINLETEAYFDHPAAIETKKKEIEDQENILKQLKYKEKALLAKGANLPEDKIKRNAELAGFQEVVNQNELIYNYTVDGVKDPHPNGTGEKIIEKHVNEAIAAHREKQIALSELREKLHTAQSDIKAQWEALVDLKIQQAKEGVTTYTLCQFNPATLDQAVASWVPDEGEATPGDRFTMGPLSSQRSGDAAQLPRTS